MDCSDIVIGTARGSLSRVMDYYTRDRSTPREDEVYGGWQSLTAAAGKEVDGITTILFRRKLKSTSTPKENQPKIEETLLTRTILG